MLSYMLPVDEKPPAGPGKAHLQLTLSPTLTNGRAAANGGGHHAAAITTHAHATAVNNAHIVHHLNNNAIPASSISKENSISSFASDATTATASYSSATPTSIGGKPINKVLINGGKHQSLKRVSFGSSKGSMVETLIYETPVQEEPETSPIQENATPFPADHDQTEDEREKVRVSIVQQSKPLEVVLPDEPVVLSENDFMMATAAMQDANHVGNAMVTKFVRQESTDSGWDNPFRPGGDLSREADEIVELIKGGKPITPTSAGNASPLPPSADELIDSNQTSTPITESPKKAVATPLAATPKTAKNGNVQNDAKSPVGSPPGKKTVGGVASPLIGGGGGKNELDVQRGHTLAAGDASQVEHVVIKKKPKCKCCVLQ